MTLVRTIGYESASVEGFVDTLRSAGVELLVDVRAVASSRRPGFAKTRLAANLAEAGLEYVHLRALGTPAEGRAAARSGRHDEMKVIYRDHLATAGAQEGLARLEELVRSARPLALMCFEHDPAHCHRSLVVAALAARMPVRAEHLMPEVE